MKLIRVQVDYGSSFLSQQHAVIALLDASQAEFDKFGMIVYSNLYPLISGGVVLSH